jgi:hypothetical protein
MRTFTLDVTVAVLIFIFGFAMGFGACIAVIVWEL